MGSRLDEPVPSLCGEWPSDGLEAAAGCPVCGSRQAVDELRELADTTFGSAPGLWRLQRCAQCGCAYLNPRPSAATLGLAYGNYYTHATAAAPTLAAPYAMFKRAVANSFRNRYFGAAMKPALPGGWLFTSMMRQRARELRMDARGLDQQRGEGGRLLDVGCGNGKFLVFARSAGWEGYGVEMDAAACEAAGALGVPVIGSDVAGLDASYESFFDIITLSHVIEHVHDPVGMLVQCRALLKPGGVLWLETPNIDSVGYETFGRYWRGLEVPRHLVLFGVSSLRLAMERAAFSGLQFLAPRDVTGHMFRSSAVMREGRIAERGRPSLSLPGRLKLLASVRAARSAVRRRPEKSEFLTAVAFRDHA